MWAWKYWDVVLAVAGFLVQCGLAWMGLTLAHWKHLVRFFTLVIIGAVFTAFAVYRGVQAGEQIERKLDVIEQNTEKPQPPPIVNINPQIAATQPRAIVNIDSIKTAWRETYNGQPTGRLVALASGKKIALNVTYINTGDATADISGGGTLYLSNSSDENTQGQLIQRFKSELSRQKFSTAPLPPGGHQGYWFTARTDREIDKDDLDQLASGKEILFLFASITYKDPSGVHHVNTCWRLQSPAFDPEVWHVCTGYEDHD